MTSIVEKKMKEYNAEDEFTRTQKIARYLISRGYESEMVWEELS
jgi:SOS response regulatory protein OraA/RecX